VRLFIIRFFRHLATPLAKHRQYPWLLQQAWLGLVMSLTLGGAALAEDKSYALLMPDQQSKDILEAAEDETENTLVSPMGLVHLIALCRAAIDTSPPDLAMPESVRLSHAVWYDSSIIPSPAAQTQLNEVWQAHQESLDLASEGMEKINIWAEKSTNGLIPRLIASPLTNANVAVTNAMYFKDSWSSPFVDAMSTRQDFRLSDGRKVAVPFVTGPESFPSWQNGNATLVALSFKRGGYLLLRLPDTGANSEFAGDAQLDVTEAAFVRVAMPKLDLSADIDLSGIIKSLGMYEALQEGLASLIEGSALPGPAVQSVVFKADEDGVEAAAASAVIGVRSVLSQDAPLVTFDRPFEFFLMMPGHETALIAGFVGNPA